MGLETNFDISIVFAITVLEISKFNCIYKTKRFLVRELNSQHKNSHLLDLVLVTMASPHILWIMLKSAERVSGGVYAW